MNHHCGPSEIISHDVCKKMERGAEIIVSCVSVVLAIIVIYPKAEDWGDRPSAITQITALETALHVFRVDNGYLPRGPDGLLDLMQKPSGATHWHGPYMEKAVPLDPWGHAYIYQCPGLHNPQSYDLSTVGPDGQVIGNWRQE